MTDTERGGLPPIRERKHAGLGVRVLQTLIAITVLLGFGELVAGAIGWTGLHFWRASWILLAPLLLIPGVVVSAFWPTRQKARLLAWLTVALVLGVALMFPMLREVQDRGVRRDIPALEEAWADYQAGTLETDKRLKLHWYSTPAQPLIAIEWSGFINYDYGSVFVPNGRHPCDMKPFGFCRCHEVETRFYFCETDP